MASLLGGRPSCLTTKQYRQLGSSASLLFWLRQPPAPALQCCRAAEDEGPSSSGREDPQSVSTSRQRARKTPGVPVTADGTPKDTKKKGARARKRRQVPRVAQVDPSAPIQSSAKFETLVKGTTTCQQLMGLVEKRPALKPSEVVLVCNQLSKVCDPQKMTVRAWSEVQVFAQQLLHGLDPYMDKLEMQELVVLMAALAKVRFKPQEAWLSRFFALSMEVLPQYGPGYITILLRALTRLDIEYWELKEVPGYRAWLEAILEVAQSKVWAYRADELVRTLVALSELRWRPAPEWMSAFSQAIRAKLDVLDPPLLSRAMLAFAQLRMEPDAALTRALYTQLTSKLPMFDDHDLATAAQALALLKRLMTSPRTEFFADFLYEVLQKLPTFSPSALANLLHAMAELVPRGQLLPCGPAGLAGPGSAQPALYYAAAAASVGGSVSGGLGGNGSSAAGPAVGSSSSSRRLDDDDDLDLSSGGASVGPLLRAAPDWEGAAGVVPEGAGMSVSSAAAGGALMGPGVDAALAESAALGGGTPSGALGLLPSQMVAAPPPEPLNPSTPSGRASSSQQASTSAPSSTLAFSSLSSLSSMSSMDGEELAAAPSRRQPPASLERPVRPAAAAAAPQERPALATVSAPMGVQADASTSSSRPGEGTSSSSSSSPRLFGRDAGSSSSSMPSAASSSSSNGASNSSSSPATSSMDGGSRHPGYSAPLPGPSPAWLSRVAERLAACAPTMSVASLGMGMRALGVLGLQAPPSLLDSFLAATRDRVPTLAAQDVVHYAQALASFGYRPPVGQEAAWNSWFAEFCRTASRRMFSVSQVCDLVPALAGLPSRPPERLLAYVLRFTRLNRPSALRHASPARLSALAQGLRALSHEPDFGFQHSFAQAVRCHWSNLAPQEASLILASLVTFKPSPLAIDELWVSEFLLMVQCSLHTYDGAALARVVRAAAELPAAMQQGAGPGRSRGMAGSAGPRWAMSVLARADEVHSSLSAEQAADILWACAMLQQQAQTSASPLGPASLSQLAVPEPLLSRLALRASTVPGAQAGEVVWALGALGAVVPAALQERAAAAAAAVRQQGPGSKAGAGLNGRGHGPGQAAQAAGMVSNGLPKQQQPSHSLGSAYGSSWGATSHPGADDSPLPQHARGRVAAVASAANGHAVGGQVNGRRVVGGSGEGVDLGPGSGSSAQEAQVKVAA